jgi:hypothetical protein
MSDPPNFCSRSHQNQLDKTKIGPGSTIIPIILKEIRRRPSSRAYVLLAYLPHHKSSLAPLMCPKCLSCVHVAYFGPDGEAWAEGQEYGKWEWCGVPCPSAICLLCRGLQYPEQVQATCVMTGDCVECPVKSTLTWPRMPITRQITRTSTRR